MKSKRFHPVEKIYLTNQCKKLKRYITELRYEPRVIGSTVTAYFNTDNPKKLTSTWLLGDAPDKIRNYILGEQL
jgi:hypothetical protein